MYSVAQETTSWITSPAIMMWLINLNQEHCLMTTDAEMSSYSLLPLSSADCEHPDSVLKIIRQWCCCQTTKTFSSPAFWFFPFAVWHQYKPLLTLTLMQFIIYVITTYIFKVNTLDALRNKFPDSERELTSVAAGNEMLHRGRIFWLAATDRVVANKTQHWMDTIMHTCRFEMACQIIFYLIFSDVLEAEK